jgi:manganese/zinc/iron transport system substrate-binding protein
VQRSQRAVVQAWSVRWLRPALVTLLLLVALATVGGERVAAQGDAVRVVATTTQAADLARNVGGDRVEVQSIMGPGVDPHLYRASEGDLLTMFEADVILYNGLNLEGQMEEILDSLAEDRPVVALGEAVPEEMRLQSEQYQGEFDPHIWFDPTRWSFAVQATATALAEFDPDDAAVYQANAAAYVAQIQALDAESMAQISSIPQEQRVLITAHDAFNYFGDRYGVEVIGIQGISTETEAGIADLQAVADLIVQRQIQAIFVESTISPATIEAVQGAVRDRGAEIVIGGQLYSDAMGEGGTPEGTYVGMFRHNVQTIGAALGGQVTTTPVATPAA